VNLWSKHTEIVYRFTPGNCPQVIKSDLCIQTDLLPLNRLTGKQWSDIRGFQGFFRVLYLVFRYGSRRTYVLLARVGDTLVHIEWLIPERKIRHRYPFVTTNSYSIISCLTSPAYRGKNIYPSQIQQVIMSDIPAREYLIWADIRNTPSHKGIVKAGGVKFGTVERKKYFGGLFSRIKTDLCERP
jgi:hypothetical protein